MIWVKEIHFTRYGAKWFFYSSFYCVVSALLEELDMPFSGVGENVLALDSLVLTIIHSWSWAWLGQRDTTVSHELLRLCP